jgi:hypothetical protein
MDLPFCLRRQVLLCSILKPQRRRKIRDVGDNVPPITTAVTGNVKIARRFVAV